MTHYTDGYYTTYKLKDYTNELAEQHRISKTENFSTEILWKLFNEIMNTEV